MYIKQLELYNFRQYKGKNIINLETSDNENIIIVSGMNGFGKTNFLISIVWCLYGNDTDKVDEFFKKIFEEQGGAKRYIANSLNWKAKNEGESRFHVAVTFSDVEIAAIPCQTIEIRRSYDINSSTDPQKLEILFDGEPNQLALDYSYELFIRDFLIPLEIAKFFFFDAEKIISLADSASKSISERKALSKAYSEVLGIQKYEDLRANLEELQIRFTKTSATPDDQKKLIGLEQKIDKNDLDIRLKEEEIESLKAENISLHYESNEYQKKLIKHGNKISPEELESLRRKEQEVDERYNRCLQDLHSLLDIAPFAIAGDIMIEISEQIEKESKAKGIKFHEEEIDRKTEEILEDIEERKREFPEIIRPKISEFYNSLIRQLIRKYFFNYANTNMDDEYHLHDFSDIETREFNTIISRLKSNYKQHFESLERNYSYLKREKEVINKQIREAETNEEDPIISEYRRKKNVLDEKIAINNKRIEELNQEIGSIKNQQNALKGEISELSKKVKIALQLKEKYELNRRLISRIKEFILRFKEEKRKRFSDKIFNALHSLMHKKLISSVEVEMIGEDIEIHLKDSNGENVPKESLSNGEKQLYATALLRALSEESGVEFPVFVDSPMQKLDTLHSEQIILSFYPNISKQVVIFPILAKELTEEEYEKIKKYVRKTFLIDHRDGVSKFEEVPKEKLFLEFKNKKDLWKSI